VGRGGDAMGGEDMGGVVFRDIGGEVTPDPESSLSYPITWASFPCILRCFLRDEG